MEASNLLASIKKETLTKNNEEQEKLSQRADQMQDFIYKMTENFNFLASEFEKLCQEYQKPMQSSYYPPRGKDPVQFSNYLKEAKDFNEHSNDELYNEVKRKIDKEIEEELGNLSNIISELENKQEYMDHNKQPDPEEKSKVKSEVNKSLIQYQTRARILELSSYIDSLNSRNLSRDDQSRLAYIEEKLNQSKIAGDTQLYMTDIYPDENIDLSKTFKKPNFLNFSQEEEEKELPSVRVNQMEMNETLSSAFSDLKSVKLENYDISISDMLELNSILQSNFYKSLDNFTHFQTYCLKKNLDSEITQAEKLNNTTILSRLKENKYFPPKHAPSNPYGTAFESFLHNIVSILQQVFKQDLNIDIVIKEKNSESDLDKISFIKHTENTLYKFHFTTISFPSITEHPITFEKFTSEIRFYLAASLKVDPNVIRVVRIKKEDVGVSVDVDIRTKGVKLEELQEKEATIQKRFGETSCTMYGYLKKFNISLDDFNFCFNMNYGGPEEIHDRAGHPYYIPGHGWKRIGLNVLKYRQEPPYNDDWLATRKKGAWAVAYHGLRYEGCAGPLSGIIQGGFSRGWSNYHEDKEFQLDVSINSVRIENNCIENEDIVRVFLSEKLIDGVNHTYEEIGVETRSDKPWEIPKIAHFNYLRPHAVELNGKISYFLIAFQCRINPIAIRIPILQRDYIIINGPENVRPYGIMLKEVSKSYYDEWNKRYDFMGRFFQTEKIIYKEYYNILESGLKAKMIEDFSILGHKKFQDLPKALKKFPHIYNRGRKPYHRPTLGWIRIGLNVDKLYPHIDWRSRLTRGTKSPNEWAVGYMLFDVKHPECYKKLPEKVGLFDEFKDAEAQAEMFECEGRHFKILIQARYNISVNHGPKKIPKELLAKGIRIMVNGDQCLPYGLLIKEVDMKKLLHGLLPIKEEIKEDESAKHAVRSKTMPQVKDLNAEIPLSMKNIINSPYASRDSSHDKGHSHHKSQDSSHSSSSNHGSVKKSP